MLSQRFHERSHLWFVTFRGDGVPVCRSTNLWFGIEVEPEQEGRPKCEAEHIHGRDGHVGFPDAVLEP